MAPQGTARQVVLPAMASRQILACSAPHYALKNEFDTRATLLNLNFGHGYGPDLCWVSQFIESGVEFTLVDEVPWISADLGAKYSLAVIENRFWLHIICKANHHDFFASYECFAVSNSSTHGLYSLCGICYIENL